MKAESADRSAPTVSSHHTVVRGVRCHHLEAGDGPPLVLLHGTAFDSAALSYGATLAPLAKRHRVFALDWPGYGESEAPRSMLSMGDYVDLLDARMPVPLVAYLAMHVPLLQRGVVWGLRRSKTLTRLVLSVLVFADRRLVTESLVEEVHRQVGEAEAERSFIAWLRGELRPFRLATSYAELLGGVDVPTLLLHGRRDLVVPWRKAQGAYERMPRSRLVVVPRCGHWVMREAPGAFVDTLLEFTAEHA